MNPQMTIRILPAGQSVNFVHSDLKFSSTHLDLEDDDVETEEKEVIPRKRKRLTHLTQDERLMRR